MFKIENNIVYIKKETPTESQPNAHYFIPYCREKKIAGEINKSLTIIDQPVTISLNWKKFDLTQEVYVDDLDNTNDFNIFILDDTGTELLTDIVPVTDGEFTISFPQAGEYIIKTTNVGVDNAKIKVVVE